MWKLLKRLLSAPSPQNCNYANDALHFNVIPSSGRGVQVFPIPERNITILWDLPTHDLVRLTRRWFDKLCASLTEEIRPFVNIRSIPFIQLT